MNREPILPFSRQFGQSLLKRFEIVPVPGRSDFSPKAPITQLSQACPGVYRPRSNQIMPGAAGPTGESLIFGIGFDSGTWPVKSIDLNGQPDGPNDRATPEAVQPRSPFSAAAGGSRRGSPAKLSDRPFGQGGNNANLTLQTTRISIPLQSLFYAFRPEISSANLRRVRNKQSSGPSSLE